MKRLLMNKLLEWKNSDQRKPLILQGVRRAGKTWMLKEFGRRCYKNAVCFNFEEQDSYGQFFRAPIDPKQILQSLMMAGGCKIEPRDTLIIFDEIQACPGVISSLKYFCDEVPEYHVACASSQPGMSLAKGSYLPPDKVNLMELGPLTFGEFLLASGHDNLFEYLNQVDAIEPVPDFFFARLYDELKKYMVTGGMPEAVVRWAEYQDVQGVPDALDAVIKACRADFAGFPGIFYKLSLLYDCLPAQLSRENKKFLYRAVRPGARAREYADDMQHLLDARLVHKVCRSKAPKLPADAYDEPAAFKLYLPDVGVLRRLCRIEPSAFAEGNRLFTACNGALAENYALQSLILQFESAPRYWSRNNPFYEVEFLVQKGSDVIPVAVEPYTNKAGKSLKKFKELFEGDIRLGVRLCLDNLKLDGDVLNIPLFMADQTGRLIELALDRLPRS